MAQLAKIVQYLNQVLAPSTFQDHALNGLQVESPNTEVRKVAVAVDAATATIDAAAKAKAQLLVVHHGLFWGKEQSITGTLARKVQTLMHGGVSLYASHLPLDAHGQYGNNVLLADYFGVKAQHEFAQLGDRCIGRYAILNRPSTLSAFVRVARKLCGTSRAFHLLPFGPARITKVGFVSGSGSSTISEAARLGLDLLISGEPKHEAYHLAKELSINVLFAGHYRTETFGVKSLGQVLEKRFRVGSVFIEHDTDI